MVFNKKEIEKKVEDFLTSELTPLGYKIAAVDFLKTHQGMLLRIYIDKENGDVTSDDLAKLHRRVEGLIAQQNMDELKSCNYDLELSSPGLNRILRKKEDFIRFSGKEVQVWLNEPLEGVSSQRNFTGILKGMKDDKILLETVEKEIKIPYERVKSANIKYSFAKKEKKVL